MATMVKVRRQGGARIVTLPAALLARIGADTGTTLAVEVEDGALIAKPVPEPSNAGRRRYTLDELLIGAEQLPDLYRAMQGALEGGPDGDEIG